MIHLPVFTKLIVSGYRLFPGRSDNPGINWDFSGGLTVIAGINGLGKTTLLNMLLRSLTGPYDLAGEGLPPELSSTLPASPVKLNTHHLRFFAQRVADAADNATVTVEFKLGKTTIAVNRSLENMGLLSLTVDGKDRVLC